MKTIILDYAGLVGAWHPDIYAGNLSRIYHLPLEEAEAFLNGPFFRDCESGKRTFEEFHRHLFSQGSYLGNPPSAGDLLNGVYEDDPAVLATLKRHAGRVVIAENATAWDVAWQREHLASFGLIRRQFASGELKSFKTDRAFFARVLEELRLQASDVIFLDDKEKYAGVARSAGIDGRRYRTVEDLKGLL